MQPQNFLLLLFYITKDLDLLCLLTLVLMFPQVFLHSYVTEKRYFFLMYDNADFSCKLCVDVVQTKLRWNISSQQRAVSLDLTFFFVKSDILK